MATPQLSPGVLVREVDLTVGRADNVLDNIGAIAGPFPTGPVDEAVDIPTERDLIRVYGKPLSLDGQYEYWINQPSSERCFSDFHVGIVTLNKTQYRKSDKFQALLSYISNNVEVRAC